MKRFLILIVTIFLTVNVYAQADRVLFIGNSMTFFNDMPVIFKNIAESKGKTVEITSQTAGGAGFVHHVDNPAVFQTIRSKIYDYVVLQPGTAESAGVSFPVDVTANRGKILRDSIRKYSPCSKIFLYEIPYGVRAQNDYANYFDVQKQIKDSITRMSELMQVEMIPAGESARAHYASSQDLALHSTYNDVHPNLNGSYLVAASIFSAIYQQASYPSAFFGGLAPNTAEYYQQVSGDTVLTNPSQWLTNFYHTNADFSVSVNGQQMNFTNNSSNYDSLLWDFGDGTTSTSVNPSHQYAAQGTYNVTLTVFRNQCSSVKIKTINLNQLMTAENKFQGLKIYPNPTSDFVFYDFGKDIDKIEIYDSAGRKLSGISNVSKSGKIDFNHYPKGVYIIKIYVNKNIRQVKIIKK